MIGKLSDGTADVERLKYYLAAGTLVMRTQYSTGKKALIDFYKDGPSNHIGEVVYNESNVQYNETSDIRLKENITPIENHFEILDKLNPVNFSFKTNPDKYIDGIIADETYETCSDASCSREPGALKPDGTPAYLGIDTNISIPILTQSIKGNMKEIQELKKKNQNLEHRMDELEMKLRIIIENQ